jgi:hypothetical protein
MHSEWSPIGCRRLLLCGVLALALVWAAARAGSPVGLLRVPARAAVVWNLVLLAAEGAVEQEKDPRAAQGALLPPVRLACPSRDSPFLTHASCASAGRGTHTCLKRDGLRCLLPRARGSRARAGQQRALARACTAAEPASRPQGPQQSLIDAGSLRAGECCRAAHADVSYDAPASLRSLRAQTGPCCRAPPTCGIAHATPQPAHTAHGGLAVEHGQAPDQQQLLGERRTVFSGLCHTRSSGPAACLIS